MERQAQATQLPLSMQGGGPRGCYTSGRCCRDRRRPPGRIRSQAESACPVDSEMSYQRILGYGPSRIRVERIEGTRLSPPGHSHTLRGRSSEERVPFAFFGEPCSLGMRMRRSCATHASRPAAVRCCVYSSSLRSRVRSSLVASIDSLVSLTFVSR